MNLTEEAPENAGNVLKLSFVGDGVLRETAEEVEVIDEEVRGLIKDMSFTMKTFGGIGLAAPQVNHSIRLIVIKVDPATNDVLEEPMALINPVIVESDGTQSVEEGCLSVPGASFPVQRPNWIKVKALSDTGEEVTITATDLASSVISHEIDHLNGILFIDKLTPLKRDIAVRKAKKFLKKYKRYVG